MTTLNERIKELRKMLNLSQKDFAYKIGISQRSVSWGEQPDNNVPDSTLKTICLVFNVNEEWLRNGTEPMFTQPSTFSLDEFVKSKGATSLELEIVKAYFELDPDVRKAAITHFKKKISGSTSTPSDLHEGIPDTPEELERHFPPINSNTQGQLG